MTDAPMADILFRDLLLRYSGAPPHALLLTTRRFGSTATASPPVQTSSAQVVAHEDRGAEESESRDADSPEGGQGLLNQQEVAALAEVLCGFAPVAGNPGYNRHPDFFAADPVRRNLRVEEIAPIFTRICYPPVAARKRLIVIEHAQRLTTHAANALLKSIEEPVAEVLYVLTAPSVAHVMPTIASRCIRLHMPASGAAPRPGAILDPSEAEFLGDLVNTIARSSVASLVSKTSPSNQQSKSPKGGGLVALGASLSKAEALAKAHTAETLIGALADAAATTKRQLIETRMDPQAQTNLAANGVSWLVERLRCWQRALDYNPNAAMRLCELVIAAHRAQSTAIGR